MKDENINEHNEPKNNEQDEQHVVKTVSGMYKNWFLDYASYVILERAVPHVYDGFKPVQRRIMHAMKRLDDGRYNKVANIIGFTMQYHPHGDASIGDAIVQLGQKELLIDTQGNWGNVFTGDRAAAARYIEARLTKFALDVVFNPKTTKWKASYDGRNKEPVHLPVKFPLLLAQGVEGIAVGLASKILPHNFIELIDASVKYLKNEEFQLFPDFLTGGFIDVSKYNDGLRGGKVRVRAKIEKTNSKNELLITQLPFGKNTGSLIDSIVSANEKGKIKIKKVVDKTSDQVRIVVSLLSGSDLDQTIDALYAFTDCEISISSNVCVIDDEKPNFVTVSEILKISADRTLALLKEELQIRLAELAEAWHFSSLEKIFIENRIYIRIEECETWEAIIETIDEGLTPFKPMLKREVTVDDITRLTEIKIKRISKYDAFKADRQIKALEDEIEEVEYNLAHIVQYTIDYFERIKEKYGKGKERRTEIRNFDDIVASNVAVANKKLYVNRKEGFAGMELKKDDYVSDCSDIDDIIIFRKDCTYVVTKVSDKFFIGNNVIHIAVFKRNDTRTIYNVAYRDGKSGTTYVKRFFVKSVTRDREYNLSKSEKFSEVLYFSENPNGEAEKIYVKLKPKPRLRVREWEFDFSEIAIKNRNAQGNILTKHSVHKIIMRSKGESTLGGEKVWFDESTFRLKKEEVENSRFLGEFNLDDKVLVVRKTGHYRTTTTDTSNHYSRDLVYLEKFNDKKVYNAIYYNADQKYHYLKRFTFDNIDDEQSFIGDHEKSFLVEVTDIENPLVELTFGGSDKGREPETFEADEFIKVKSVAARGKRLSTYKLASMKFIKPEKPETKEKKDPTDKPPVNEPEFEIIRPSDEPTIF